MLPFLKVVEPDFHAVNDLIINRLHSDVGLVENIGHYIVDAGGKRLRPILVLLTARALGYEAQQHTNLAAIIEFIHTATLLHDDVVDVSELRRGRPTANAKFGNAPSVLVGDFLYSRAFQMMVEIGEMKIMNILADTTNTISEGEVQQLVNAKDPSVDEQRYMTVIYKKTAALFEAACSTAAVLSQADQEASEAARQYGLHLGQAFQLVDDMLDYQGDSEALGKNVGDDLAEGKPTLPLIYAMQNGSEQESKIIADAISTGDLNQLENIVSIVSASGGLQYTKDKAQFHVDQAINALRALPDNAHTKAMSDLAQFSVDRSY